MTITIWRLLCVPHQASHWKVSTPFYGSVVQLLFWRADIAETGMFFPYCLLKASHHFIQKITIYIVKDTFQTRAGYSLLDTANRLLLWNSGDWPPDILTNRKLVRTSVIPKIDFRIKYARELSGVISGRGVPTDGEFGGLSKNCASRAVRHSTGNLCRALPYNLKMWV